MVTYLSCNSYQKFDVKMTNRCMSDSGNVQPLAQNESDKQSFLIESIKAFPRK